jgi:hypothetical protein
LHETLDTVSRGVSAQRTLGRGFVLGPYLHCGRGFQPRTQPGKTQLTEISPGA